MKLKIHIINLQTGEVNPVEVGISDTLRDLKHNISDSQGINLGAIRKFVFADTRLKYNEVAVVDQINAILVLKPQFASIDDDQTANVMVEMEVSCWGGGERPVPELRKGRLQIHVKSSKPCEIPVEIPVEIAPTDTVDDLKEKIFNETDIDPDHQRFIFNGIQLNYGIVFDKVNAILASRPQLPNSADSEPMPGCPSDERIVHVTIYMVMPLRGGGNAVHHHDEVQWRSSSSHSDSDGENPGDEGGNTVSDEVQGTRSQPPMPELSNGNKHLQNGNDGKKSAWCGCFSFFCYR